ncbi:hypothetical protein OsJ_31331 [Oryza sativa Japonica Group]|uniref:Uncharacterized protein n=1 Tax=Oryza sativa subsp. japonica TaxID=39947 RepID=B9G5H8_ORYSJ|nr:hypothetical protein OsJ_31331 [Oryza sativa Japonica Group]
MAARRLGGSSAAARLGRHVAAATRMTTRLSTTHGNKTLKTRGRFSPGNKIGKGTRRQRRQSGGKHKIDDDGGAREDTAARITLSDDKYQVIKSPSDINLNNNPCIYLGRTKNGVYCASIDLKQHQRLQVWQLHELHGGGYHLEWMLIHDVSLDQIMADFRWNPEAVRPWIEHDMYCDDAKNDREISQEESTGWDSEDDSILYTEDMPPLPPSPTRLSFPLSRRRRHAPPPPCPRAAASTAATAAASTSAAVASPSARRAAISALATAVVERRRCQPPLPAAGVPIRAAFPSQHAVAVTERAASASRRCCRPPGPAAFDGRRLDPASVLSGHADLTARVPSSPHPLTLPLPLPLTAPVRIPLRCRSPRDEHRHGCIFPAAATSSRRRQRLLGVGSVVHRRAMAFGDEVAQQLWAGKTCVLVGGAVERNFTIVTSSSFSAWRIQSSLSITSVVVLCIWCVAANPGDPGIFKSAEHPKLNKDGRRSQKNSDHGLSQGGKMSSDGFNAVYNSEKLSNMLELKDSHS